MKAFGDLQPLSGVGEEAVAVDGKIFGAQVALRTSKAIANIAAACGGMGRATWRTWKSWRGPSPRISNYTKRSLKATLAVAFSVSAL